MVAGKHLTCSSKASLNFISYFSGEFFHIIEGTSAITLIFDQKLFEDICSLFPEKEVLDKRQSLAAIILRSPVEIIKTPGCVLAFYSTVSRKHINIEETMSCFTDTIIVVSMKDVSKAFAALTELIAETREFAVT